MSATISPMLPVRPVIRARAARFGRYPMASAAARTRLRVSGLTRCGAEKVRETVEMWTPEAPATSRMVTDIGTPLGRLLTRMDGSLMQTVVVLSPVGDGRTVVAYG